jgi:ATP-dependent DNA helicase RecQ
VLVGCFDRPNLVYRILPALDRDVQSIEIVRRHEGEATIIYCISRKDTEQLAATLNRNGIKAAHYHAGLEPDLRHRTQDAFSDERLNVIVATVAFGMGIDRSNVRCIVHFGMPKSIEHYQQETGRAGRDGLEAECVLLYSAGDVMRWESLVRHSAEGADDPAPVIEAGMQLVRQMQRICNSPICRHKTLSEYFGQAYENPNCGACDVCLGEVEGLDDATVIAQKVLSCVARTGERFGINHIVDVLQGADTDKIRQLNHQKLSTYGLLKETPKKHLQAIVFQLVDQGLLERSGSEYPTLSLNDKSWAVMRGQREVKLLRPKSQPVAKTKSNAESWDGVDRGLFDHLRAWRKQVAAQRGTPPFLVLDDHALRDLARVRPTDEPHLRGVHGIGAKRLADFGKALLETIGPYCREHGLTTDQTAAPPEVSSRLTENPIVRPKGGAQEAAFLMFAQKRTIDEVCAACNRARATVIQYLGEFIAAKRPASIDAWVHLDVQQRVLAAAAAEESGRIKPIFEKLSGEVPYEEIRLVLAHLATQS